MGVSAPPRPGLAAGATGADERGISLLELLIVLLLIAILMTIASSVLLGALRTAGDRAAQASLRQALGSAAIVASDSGAFTGADATQLTRIGAGVTFVDAPAASTASNVVSVHVPSPDVWVAVAQSRTGVCFAIRDSTPVRGGVRYASNAGAPCDAQQAWAVNAGDPGW